MERIVNNFNWLLRLVKSNNRVYVRLINQATPDQIRSVIECVHFCSRTKLVKAKKEIRSVTRIISFNRSVRVFLSNRTAVRQVVFFAIFRLVRYAVTYVIDNC